MDLHPYDTVCHDTTRHDKPMKQSIKPIIFYQFEKGVSCFFKRGGCTLKSLSFYALKELKPI